jgi:hypothetical protein
VYRDFGQISIEPMRPLVSASHAPSALSCIMAKRRQKGARVRATRSNPGETPRAHFVSLLQQCWHRPASTAFQAGRSGLPDIPAIRNAERLRHLWLEPAWSF